MNNNSVIEWFLIAGGSCALGIGADRCIERSGKQLTSTQAADQTRDFVIATVGFAALAAGSIHFFRR